MPKGIANIFSINEIEKLHCITYNSIDGYYVVHTDKCPVYFYKDQQGLPCIDLDAYIYDAATTLVQTVRSNYEGFTKKDIKAAKATRKILPVTVFWMIQIVRKVKPYHLLDVKD